jgi:hypothetical protein
MINPIGLCRPAFHFRDARTVAVGDVARMDVAVEQNIGGTRVTVIYIDLGDVLRACKVAV